MRRSFRPSIRPSFRMFMCAIPFVIACSHKQAAQPVAPTAPPAAAQATEPAHNAASTPVSPNLAVADDLGKRCRLHFGDRQEAPKFDFDQFQLLPEDRDVLDQV